MGKEPLQSEPGARPLARAVLGVVARLLDVPFCALGSFFEGQCVFEEVLDQQSGGVDPGFKVPLEDTLAGLVESSGFAVIRGIPGTLPLGRFERELGMRSALYVPVALQERVWGCIATLHPDRRSFKDEDVRLVTEIAQAAAAEIGDRMRRKRDIEVERARLSGLVARGLAHDFGNVLSSALANARSLQRIADVLPEAREPIDELCVSLEAGRELVARLRGLGRSDTKSFHRGIDPTAIASKVVGLARGMFSGRPSDSQAIATGADVDLRFVPPDIPIGIRGDETALEQALLNLVLNARDAVRERGGRVTVRVLLERVEQANSVRPWQTRGDWALLVVDDDGPGISAHQRAHIFEPGYTTKGEQGSGLGLFLVSTTAAAHGGSVVVDRSPEGGARIGICLPASRRGSSTSLRPPIVLVADDERGIRRAIARELLAAGLGVAEASSRASALEIIEADPSRIVCAIVDRDLGDGSGEDVVARLRKKNPLARIIETSGSIITSGKVLEKPFDLAKLVDQVLAAVMPNS